MILLAVIVLSSLASNAQEVQPAQHDHDVVKAAAIAYALGCSVGRQAEKYW